MQNNTSRWPLVRVLRGLDRSESSKWRENTEGGKGQPHGPTAARKELRRQRRRQDHMGLH